MFYKTGIFENFGKLSRKRLCRSFFLTKLYTIKPATLLKRAFSSDVLLWILLNCFKDPFYRTPPGVLLISIQPSWPLACEGRISIFSKHYLVLDISKPLSVPVEARNKSIWFYTKCSVKQALFLTSFSAAQHTSMRNYRYFFKRSYN